MAFFVFFPWTTPTRVVAAKLSFFDSRWNHPKPNFSLRLILTALISIHYDLTSIYRSLKTFPSFKEKVEERLISFAKRNLSFDFSFVLYDVNTFYYESFSKNSLRKSGYSKGNKIDQPQILIGLIIDKTGFSLSFSVFKGY